MESECFSNKTASIQSIRSGKVVAEPANPQSFAYFSFLFTVVGIITFILAVVRLSFQQNPSLFKDHEVFTIMIIVSGSTAVVASGILILVSLLLPIWIKDIHYTILKTIGSFSAFVLPISLGALLFVPSGDLNWIAYTLLCVVFGGFLYLYSLIWKVACAYHQEDVYNIYPVHWTFLLIILVPLPLALVPFFSPNIWLAFLMCLIFFIIIVFTLMCFSSRQHKHLQQDKTIDHSFSGGDKVCNSKHLQQDIP